MVNLEQNYRDELTFFRGKLPPPTIKFREWFLSKSETFNTVDLGLSRKLQKLNQCKKKQCYYNAWKSDITGHYRYFEGFVISDDLPISLEHSWLVKDGVVIDPTLIIGNRLGDEYFGIEIKRGWLNKHVLDTETTGGFLTDYYLHEAKGGD